MITCFFEYSEPSPIGIALYQRPQECVQISESVRVSKSFTKCAIDNVSTNNLHYKHLIFVAEHSIGFLSNLVEQLQFVINVRLRSSLYTPLHILNLKSSVRPIFVIRICEVSD